jgi:ADP-ribose pyrophosphatase YjhB (NUDIX family)
MTVGNSPLHSVSVAGVVVDSRERIMIIRRHDNGEWQIPGGVLELDESIQDGVRREIQEETGVMVQVGRLTGIYKNMRQAVVALVFRCAPESGDAQPTAEASEVRWITREQATEMMTPAFVVRVLDAFADRTQVRTHDGVDLLTA